MRYLTLLLQTSILLTCFANTSAQKGDSKEPLEPDLKAQIIRFEIQRLKEGLIKDASTLAPFDRAIFWAHLGNLIWKDDEETGHRMLEKAVDTIETEVAPATKEKKRVANSSVAREQLVDATRIVMRTVGVRDKHLTERLLGVLAGLDDAREKGASDRSNNIAEALVDSALLTLEKDVKRAARLASISLGYGESNKFPLFLISLRKQNSQLADSLFSEALDVGQSTRSANLLLALSYVAFPSVYDPSTNVEAIPDKLRTSLVKALVGGVLREDRPSEPGYCIHATILARLLGEVDRLLPQHAAVARVTVAKCQAKSLHVEEALSEAPMKTVDDFLTAAGKAPTPERRVLILVRASQLAAQQQDFPRAIRILDNLTTDERNLLGETWELMRRDVAIEAAASYYAQKDLVAIYEVIGATPAKLRPFVNLGLAERALNGEKRDPAFIRERLDFAREGLARTEPDILLFYPYVSMARMYAAIDPTEAFVVLREGIKLINRAVATTTASKSDERVAGGLMEPLELPTTLVDTDAGQLVDAVSAIESPLLRIRARLSVLASLFERKSQRNSEKGLSHAGNYQAESRFRSQGSAVLLRRSPVSHRWWFQTPGFFQK